MVTEDDIGDAVRAGTMTVDDAVAASQSPDFIAYPAMGLTEGSETWQEIEELGSGSTMFADLRNARASDEQLFEIGAQIERARQEGRTLDKVYGWAMDSEPTGPTGPAPDASNAPVTPPA